MNCKKCLELMQKISKLTDALLRCNHFAAMAKNRLKNGGDADSAIKSLEAIEDYSKEGIERA